jgi:mannose-6-phosphate isomerase-like protein (cupin superfamily)
MTTTVPHNAETLVIPPYAGVPPLMRGSAVDVPAGGDSPQYRYPDYDTVYCFASGHGEMYVRGADADWPTSVDFRKLVFVASGVTHRIANRGQGPLLGFAFHVPPREHAEVHERRPHKASYDVFSGKVEYEATRQCWIPALKPNPASQISAVELAWFFENGRTVRHTSSSTEEIFYFVRGNGTVVLDGVEHAAGPGSAFLVPRNVTHEIRNTGAGAMAHFTVNTYLSGTDAA